MKTTVYQKNSHFDQVGQRLPCSLHETKEQITAGLAARLRRHANQRLTDTGFTQAAAWELEVYTMDADEKPADRAYSVRFLNEKGGYVEVVGILTNNGRPVLDHGFAIGTEN